MRILDMEDENKICSKCNIKKNVKNFGKKRRECKVCVYERNKLYILKDKDKNIEKKRIWRQNNIEHIQEYRNNYYLINKEKVKQSVNKWRKCNPEIAKELTEKWRLNNIKHIKEYNAKNREKRKCQLKKWRLDNPDKTDYSNAKQMLISMGFKKECISNELIEVKKLIIKTKRLCRTSQNYAQA